jgi:tetratricopeptide (TPR) repeat protein
MTGVTSSLLDSARASQQSGAFHQAEQLCRQLLDAEPANADAWQFLGANLQEQGKLADATACFERALQSQPTSPEAAFRLACSLAAQGKRQEAIGAFRRTLQIKPDHVDALARLGVALAESGNLGEAVSNLRQAIQLRPDFAKARHNLGVALSQQGHLEKARHHLEHALRLRPDYSEAAYNLGNVLNSMGRREEAIASFRRAIEHQPNHAGAYTNLGLALTEAGRSAEAISILQQAVRLRNQSAEAYNNLGLALADLGRFAEAEAVYQKALERNHRDPTIHNNLGSMLRFAGRLKESLTSYQIALWLDPHSASAHWNRSLAWLQAGNFEQGWPEYEWRWKRQKAKPHPFRQPLWDGSSLDGRTIVLHLEQGTGDTFQFIRYAPLVKQRGGTVVLHCPANLIPLLSRCKGIDRLVPDGAELPQGDTQAPLMSLPGIFRTTLATVPATVPYLFVDEARVESWRGHLCSLAGFKVGIAWQGNRNHAWDHHRSVPLSAFAPLASIPGVSLISLQKGYGSEQLRSLGKRLPIVDLPSEQNPTAESFVDTAAIMKNLDLVISVDTSIAHLAGGLGVPVWVGLSLMADWRWLLDCEDAPWYPGMRLFRQTRLGDWAAIFERIKVELQGLVAGQQRQQPGGAVS